MDISAECLKCGDTGWTLGNTYCDCEIGVDLKEGHLKETSSFSIIPEQYRGLSMLTGKSQLIVGEMNTSRTFQDFLSNLAKNLQTNKLGFPSLFIDLSKSQLGAYEVYYAIMEKVCENESIMDQFLVNDVSEEPLLQLNPIGTRHLYIISDFPINNKKYVLLYDYVKILKSNNADFNKYYPLIMYEIMVRDK